MLSAEAAAGLHSEQPVAAGLGAALCHALILWLGLKAVSGQAESAILCASAAEVLHEELMGVSSLSRCCGSPKSQGFLVRPEST